MSRQYPEWQGRIGKKIDLPPALKMAYNSHRSQLWRCYNPNSNQFKNYGAHGVQVHYTRRQLMQWVCDRIDDMNFKKFRIRRKDRKGHFALDNIYIHKT